MNAVLARWNYLSSQDAAKEILPCCGSRRWAHGMAARRPFLDEASLLTASDEVWHNLVEEDWMEAFRSHPRIGESRAAEVAPTRSAAWSAQEQREIATAGDAVKRSLADGNREYEKRFGHIFIVCATGKSGPEILEILQRRLHNDKATELREAAEQQRQIMRIRLERWLS
jgi:2-oxo-4-hydroxy-4-carboxy-5-ureidoimidazoline decarboxylase